MSRAAPPMPLRNHRVKVRGLPMHALVSRAHRAVDRLPVVLVHGLGMSSRYMAPTAQRLASDFRVFAPDLPGFGDSGKPDHILSVPELADALAEWMSVCGLSPAALVANSFGCQIVTQLALDHPDLIDRLVLQGPTGDPCMRTPSRQLVCLCRDWWCEPPSLVWISLTDYAKAGLPRVLRTFRYQLEDQIETRLPGIGAPTLVVHGSQDAFVSPAWAERVAQQLGRAELAVVPGMPHAANFSTPEALVRTIRAFLIAHEARGCVGTNPMKRRSERLPSDAVAAPDGKRNSEPGRP